MRKHPVDYDPNTTTLICIPCAYVDIVMGKISELEDHEQWETDTDWEQAYQVVAWIEECAMACGEQITTRLDRIIAALGYAAGLPASDPAYDATDTQRAAIERLRTQISASGTMSLDDVIAYINQLETYVYGLANLIGDNTLDPPAP